MLSKLSLFLILVLVVAMPVISVADPLPHPRVEPVSVEDLLTAAVPAWTKPHRVLIEVNMDPGSSPEDRAKQNLTITGEVIDLSTPEGVAAANGYESQWFGKVLAIAPANRTVLNTDPALYDLPLTQIAAVKPLPFLLASLTNQQFDLLAGDGLGMNDLTPDQQVLLRYLLPSPFKIVSSDAYAPVWSEKADDLNGEAAGDYQKQFDQVTKIYTSATLTVPDQDVLSQVRLHAYLNLKYSVSNPGGQLGGLSTKGDDSYSTGDRKLTMDETISANENETQTQKMAALMQIVEPNVPKQGDFSWRDPALTSLVDIAGVKTVDDVVNRIAKVTKLELYANSWYGSLPVLVGGDVNSKVVVSDLMQALALDVTGTWRKVGPAYVLTQDEIGLGAQKQFLTDVLSNWGRRVNDADADAGARMDQLAWLSSLSTFPNNEPDLTKYQLKAIIGDKAEGTVSLQSLPSGFQNALSKELTELSSQEDIHSADNTNKIIGALKKNSNVSVSVDIGLALELPNAGTMSFTDYQVQDVKLRAEQLLKSPSELIKMPESMRAVICAPKTPLEAKKVIDMLPGMGLNTLFIDVFTNGRTFFKNNAISPETDDAGNVLTAAIAEGSAKHVAVYAVVDTLALRKDGFSARPSIWPSQFDEDLNIFGEPSDKGWERRLKQKSVYGDLSDPIEAPWLMSLNYAFSWANPLDPAVRKTIPAMIKELAAVPGLAGLIFQDTVPPGYEGTDDPMGQKLGLGYALSNRVAFLRLSHVDPMDIGRSPQVESAAFSPLDFSFLFGGLGLSETGTDSWTKFRADADLSLMKSCFLAASTGNHHLQLLMRERLEGETIDPWTNFNSVNQSGGNIGQLKEYSGPDDQAIIVVKAKPILDSAPGMLSWSLGQIKGQHGHGKELGIAFDLLNNDSMEDCLTSLRELAPCLAQR